MGGIDAQKEQALFDSLPTYNPDDFGPPAWATSSSTAGQPTFPSTSTSSTTGAGPSASKAAIDGARRGEMDWDDWRERFQRDMRDPVDLGKYDRPRRSGTEGGSTDPYRHGLDRAQGNGRKDGEEEDEDDAEETWQDAVEEHPQAGEADGQRDESKVDFTTEEMEDLLKTATALKTKANLLFSPSNTTAQPNLDGALEAYKSALDHLPLTSLSPDHPSNRPAPPPTTDPTSDESTIAPTLPIPELKPGELLELTDEQASAFEAQQAAAALERERVEEEERKPETMRRRDVEREMEALKKVVWGNLGAVYVKKNDDKEAVASCSQALRIDPFYVKALHRRATASERLDTWTSLTTAQEDYKTLLTLVPSDSPIYRSSKKSLAALPARITTQQEKEKDEMFGKLKDLGNGLLGKFGMSVDNFKFDPQPGGGYSMRFER